MMLRTMIWMTNDNVRLFFQVYGTFSSLVRCYFFPSRNPAKSRPWAPRCLLWLLRFYEWLCNCPIIGVFQASGGGLDGIRVRVGKEYRGWSAGVTRALSGYSHGWAPRLCPENQQVRISNASPNHCVYIYILPEPCDHSLYAAWCSWRACQSFPNKA